MPILVGKKNILSSVTPGQYVVECTGKAYPPLPCHRPTEYNFSAMLSTLINYRGLTPFSQIKGHKSSWSQGRIPLLFPSILRRTSANSSSKVFPGLPWMCCCFSGAYKPFTRKAISKARRWISRASTSRVSTTLPLREMIFYPFLINCLSI
jgi:hypothetical protein